MDECSLPNKGIASDTCGKVSATKLRNTVSDRRIVTPIKNASVVLELNMLLWSKILCRSV